MRIEDACGNESARNDETDRIEDTPLLVEDQWKRLGDCLRIMSGEARVSEARIDSTNKEGP